MLELYTNVWNRQVLLVDMSDSAGSVLLAVYTIVNWSGTASDHAGWGCFPNLLNLSSVLQFFSSEFKFD